MSTITTVIHADKAGMIAYLEEKRQNFTDQARNNFLSQKERARLDGHASGLELAISAVEAWAEADNIVVAEDLDDKEVEVEESTS
jgi:ribosomal protein L7Ae-like RNA K-turn-binding protein